MIKQLKSVIGRYKQKKIWETEARQIISNTNRKPCNVLHTSPEDDVLIIIPHADDEWVGCSTILRRLKNRSNGVYLEFTGEGRDLKIKERRKQELSLLSKSEGLSMIFTEGVKEKDKIHSLYSTIMELKPGLIFTPCFIDWHQDHLLSNLFLYETMCRLSMDVPQLQTKICMYQVSVPIPQELITDYLPLNAFEQKDKWRVFSRIYKSQNHLPATRFMMNEKINGALIGTYAAEVFCCQSWEVWKRQMDTVIEYDITKHNLGLKINHLSLIRKETGEILSNIFH